MASTELHNALSARAWPVRFLRCLAASNICLIIAVSGHRFGGGEIASPRILGAVFVSVFVATWLLSVRQLTVGQLVGLLLIAQVVVHMGCAFGDSMIAFGPLMILGHIVATAIAALVLIRGERFLWTLADRLGLQALRLIFAPVNAFGPAPRLRFSRQDVRLPSQLVLVGGNGLRGPPVGCA